MHDSPAEVIPIAFHRRGMLFGTAISRSLGRSIRVGLVASAASGAVLGILLPGGIDGGLVVLVTAGAGGLVGLVAAVLAMPRPERLAFESFSWLGRSELDRFRARTGSSTPTSTVEAAAWLADHPPSAATGLARVEILALLGRTGQAWAELEGPPPAGTDLDRVELAGLRSLVGFVEVGVVEQGEVDELVGRLDPRSPAGLEAAAVRALGESRARLERDEDTWWDPLVAVRSRLRRRATVITLRDTWSRLLVSFAMAGAIG